MRGHGHDAHAVGETAVDGLQVFVIEGLGEQHRGDGLDQLRVGDDAVLRFVSRDARLGVGFFFAAQTHDEMCDGLAQARVLGRIGFFDGGEAGRAGFLEVGGLCDETIALGVVDRAHVGFGDGGNGTQHAFFAAAGASAVAGNERVVVGPHHEHVAQRGGF